MRIKQLNYFLSKVVNFNKVIKYLTFSDLLILSGFGLISPIFAIFIINNVNGSNLQVVGIAETIFLLAKGLVQIPTAKIIDKTKGEKDDFGVLFVGSILFSLIPLLYLSMSSPYHLYFIQLLYGVASGITLPAWYAIFTRHVDYGHAGLEWGIYRTLSDLGGALAAALGGFLAYRFGFNLLFIAITFISLTGTLLILPIYKNMKTGFVLFK